MAKSGLGKGFDGLIPVGFDVSAVAAPGESVKQVAVEKLVANPGQPRRSFDDASIKELADSITEHGIIQPLVVTKGKDDTYRIIAGERRFRASQLAGLEKVPVIVRDHKQLEEFEIAIVENVQRVDLSPIEMALSIVRLRDEFSLSPKQIAKKLGKAETTVSNIIRLLQLPEVAIEALQKNQISEGHARAILMLKSDENSQIELMNNIVTQSLSVRDAEAAAKQMKGGVQNPVSQLTSDNSKLLQSAKQSMPKTPVKITEKSDKKGIVLISYSTQEDLQSVLEKLST